VSRVRERGLRGSRRPPGPGQRILSSLLVPTFLLVHYLSTPLHLLSDDHHDGPVDQSAGEPYAYHSHDRHEEAPQETHPASDHKLIGAIVRSSPIPSLNHAAVLPVYLPAPVDPAPRPRPVQVRVFEARPPPLLSPHQPRAPPAAKSPPSSPASGRSGRVPAPFPPL